MHNDIYIIFNNKLYVGYLDIQTKPEETAKTTYKVDQ